eukprot:TRINITY_DN70731_c0_g1_i1.p1 TRINITY_DN70731_c0_g1~~TRINITY_DN70731_c0_g1_i1.p1  ORF type:complete len:158 (-),score=10.62 TRINITY_DN70731_c0_g1_i1:64-474(-)
MDSISEDNAVCRGVNGHLNRPLSAPAVGKSTLFGNWKGSSVRYSGTPAQAVNDLLNGAPSETAGAQLQPSTTTSKVSMPRHVACIRKQVLASRRLEEQADLCTPNSRPSRQRSTSSIHSNGSVQSQHGSLMRAGID